MGLYTVCGVLNRTSTRTAENKMEKHGTSGGKWVTEELIGRITTIVVIQIPYSVWFRSTSCRGLRFFSKS